MVILAPLIFGRTPTLFHFMHRMGAPSDLSLSNLCTDFRKNLVEVMARWWDHHVKGTKENVVLKIHFCGRNDSASLKLGHLALLESSYRMQTISHLVLFERFL